MKNTGKFEKHLSQYMNDDGKTAVAVSRFIDGLGLPQPRDDADYVKGADGIILFSSRFGVVIRIEPAKKCARVNDNPWILQPLGSFPLEKAIVEICPGVETTSDSGHLAEVEWGVRATGFKLNDAHEGNIGLLPVSSPHFPDGIPVLIDRPAVSVLTRATTNIKAALDDMELKADPQEKLYAPLRKALREAWPENAARPDKTKMKKFWRLCERSLASGVLIAGWDHLENCPEDGVEKQYAAADSAGNYDKKIAQSIKRRSP